MEMPDVAGLFREHRKPILIAGAGLAVTLGLKARSRSSTPAAAAGGASGVATTAAYAGRGGVYDSTANDVYNSIQPQIASLAGQLSTLATSVANSRAPGVEPRAAQYVQPFVRGVSYSGTAGGGAPSGAEQTFDPATSPGGLAGIWYRFTHPGSTEVAEGGSILPGGARIPWAPSQVIALNTANRANAAAIAAAAAK